jgi:hypothetical protein
MLTHRSFSVLLGGAFLGAILLPAVLLAASVSNEGDTAVKVSARSVKGISGGSTLQPGQIWSVKNDPAWIEHVPDNRSMPVRIKIVENDGKTGYISVPGGRYTFQQAVETQPATPTKKPRMRHTSGYADNRSNVALSLNIVGPTGAQNFVLLRPGQKTVISDDTVEVRVEQYGWVSGDAQIFLSLMMPDGKEHVVRTSHAVVRNDPAS